MTESTLKVRFRVMPSSEPVNVEVVINLEPTPHCDVILTGGPDTTPDLLAPAVESNPLKR